LGVNTLGRSAQAAPYPCLRVFAGRSARTQAARWALRALASRRSCCYPTGVAALPAFVLATAEVPSVRRCKGAIVMLKEAADRQIENARARVTRHRMAPGAHTGFHRHEYDYVIVPITGGRMRVIEAGGESTADLAAGVS
jgi:hypothetical protein